MLLLFRQLDEETGYCFGLLDVALRSFGSVRGPVESFALARSGHAIASIYLELP